jgi:hypothetical protein
MVLLVNGIVRVATVSLGSAVACLAASSCTANRPTGAGAEGWTLVGTTGPVEYGGRCPRCDAWVKTFPAGWAHGVDAAGRPWNWHGYMATCGACGADLFAERGDVAEEGRTRIIRWRVREPGPMIATAATGRASR